MSVDPSKLKVAELRQELAARGLDTKGNKPDLVLRLTVALSTPSSTTTTRVSTTTEETNKSNATHTPTPTISTTSQPEASKPVLQQPLPPPSSLTPSSSSTPTTVTIPSSISSSQGAAETPSSSTAPAQPIPIAANSNGHRLNGSGTIENDEVAKKKSRAERFGIAFKPNDQDKKLDRATRFGLPVNTEGNKNKDQQAKLEQRKLRFGSPQQGQQKVGRFTTAERLGLPLKSGKSEDATLATKASELANAMDPERIKARSQKFGQSDAKSEDNTAASPEKANDDEEKKRKRGARFAQSGAADASKRLRVDKPLEQQATAQ